MPVIIVLSDWYAVSAILDRKKWNVSLISIMISNKLTLTILIFKKNTIW